MMNMRPSGTPVTDLSNDVNSVNIQQSGNSDIGIKDESLLNLSARVQNLMNASLATEEVDENGAAETPQSSEEE
tara:strand:- start:216 stop:437 length:222 start_codon:yes stop_codon:yes gene_type:complete